MQRILIAALAVTMLVFGAIGQAKAEPIFALTTQNNLITFDSSTPGTVIARGFVSGLRSGESLVGIDFRPANGQLYALGNLGGVYTLNQLTGAATQIATLNGTTTGAGAGFTTLNGASFGVDFNPMVDRLRVVSDADQNLRINVDNGSTLLDGTLAFAGGDPNSGTDPNVVGVAYEPNRPGVPVELYGIDTTTGTLVEHDPPNAGTLITVGTMGIDASSDLIGFDISGLTNMAYAAFTISGGNPFSDLYTINTDTGLATFVGSIGGGASIVDLSVQPVPEPATMLLLGTGLAGVAAKVRKRRKQSK